MVSEVQPGVYPVFQHVLAERAKLFHALFNDESGRGGGMGFQRSKNIAVNLLNGIGGRRNRRFRIGSIDMRQVVEGDGNGSHGGRFSRLQPDGTA